MKQLFFSLSLVLVGVLPKVASAHCPLCTAGAGVLAVAAASLGVSSIVVGILIGAFATALSLWLAKMVKKQYILFQTQILVVVIYLGTVIPIMPLVRDYGPFYLSLGGEYGTLLHNTYTINLFLFGAVIGTILMIVAHPISKYITQIRGKQMPYQGMAITLFLLTFASVIVQILS